MVIEIPADGFFDTFFELEGRFPAQFLLELRGVDRVAQVVPGAVSDIGNQFFARAFRPSQESVDGFDDDLYQIDVLPLVEASDVVRFGDFPLVENQVDGPCVVFHV